MVQKCLETGEKRQNYGTLYIETGETTKSPEYDKVTFCDIHTLHHYTYIIVIIIIGNRQVTVRR